VHVPQPRPDVPGEQGNDRSQDSSGFNAIDFDDLGDPGS